MFNRLALGCSEIASGMPEKCVINVDNIMTIPKSLLSGRITVLSSDKMALVDRAILFALDLDK